MAVAESLAVVMAPLEIYVPVMLPTPTSAKAPPTGIYPEESEVAVMFPSISTLNGAVAKVSAPSHSPSRSTRRTLAPKPT